MNKPCTLFHLDGEKGLRGGEKQLLYLAGQLRAWGHENIIVCRRESALEREARRKNFKVLPLPFLCEWDILSAWKLQKAAEQHPRVLLHAHTAHTAALASLTARLGKLPYIVHRRVDFPLQGSLSRRFKYDPAHRVIAVSECIRNILLRSGMDGAKIAIVRDCLPLNFQEAQAAGLNAPMRPPSPLEREQARSRLAGLWDIPLDSFWIGNIAALVPHKDQPTLLRSIPKILSKIPNAHFFLIGEGELKKQLQTLSERLGISPHVHFTGFQEEILPWFHALDLLALSSWGEGMGSVLLEAMACSLPIAATEAGGIPEVLRQYPWALLCPPRNPERLADIVIRALGKLPSDQERVPASQVLADFSLSRAAHAVQQLYAEALA